MELALDNISLINIKPIGSPTVATASVSAYAAKPLRWVERLPIPAMRK